MRRDLDTWFRRKAARERRIVVLEEGLLGDRLWRYALYRLRFFLLRYLLESAAHAASVLLLVRGQRDGFALVVLAYAGTALLSSFWWGALEALRSEVRELYRSGKPHRIAGVIARWLAFARLLGAGVLALAVAWTAWRAAGGTLTPVDAFVAALLVRAGLELPVRCYHSGVYALRRVYKPLWATLCPELATLAALFALYPAIGIWALVVSALLGAGLVSALTVRYTREVYRFLGLDPLAAMAGRRRWRGPGRIAGRDLLTGGASYAVMALDSLVVLALLHGAQARSDAVLVLFLAAPTIRAGFDWAGILYFDLKRLELRPFANLRRRFERHTLRLACSLAVGFWAVAAGIATAVLGHAPGWFSPALLAFLVARSLLARAQVQAFARGAYGTILATGVLCLAGLLAAGSLVDAESARLGAVALVAAGSAATLALVERVDRSRGAPDALPLLEWLARLAPLTAPVVVGSARLRSAPGPNRLDARSREEAERWRLAQLAGRAARRLGPHGEAAWVGPDRVVWFEAAGDGRRISAEWLQRASGGLVDEVVERECAAGADAAVVAARAGLLGRASEHVAAGAARIDIDEARRTFEALVPGGVVYAPDGPVPPRLAALPGTELRSILADALAYSQRLAVARRRSSFDVTALCAGGELRLIFVAAASGRRRARARWRQLVTTLNARAALAT